MNWATVYERLASEYGWTPEVLRRLELRQIHAFWGALAERMEGVAAAQSSGGVSRGDGASVARGEGYTGKPAMQKTQRADGRTETTYNLLSMVAQTRGQRAWHSATH